MNDRSIFSFNDTGILGKRTSDTVDEILKCDHSIKAAKQYLYVVLNKKILFCSRF